MADGSWSFFEEDEVCRKTPDGSFVYGFVVKNSMYQSSDEEEDDEDRLEKGKVRVSWHPQGKESVVSENQLILADRSLMPGDVIRRFGEDSNSQRGFVQDLIGKCHVLIRGTNKFLYNVNSKDLSSMKVEEIARKPLSNSFCDVVMDSWVGKIERVNEEVVIKFCDGAMCRIPDTDLLEGFEPVKEHHKSFCNDGEVLYKGLIMKGNLGDLDEVVWIFSTNKHGPKAVKKSPNHAVTVRIEETKLKSVEVYWMCRGFTKSDNPLLRMTPPPSKVEGPDLERLQLLDWFSHCSLQIGDFAQYVLKPSDELVEIPSKLSFIPDIMLNKQTVQDTVTEKYPVETSQTSGVETEEVKDAVNGDIGDEVEAEADENEEYEDIDTSESEPEEEKSPKKPTASHSRHKGRKGHKFGAGAKRGGKLPKQTVKFEPEYPVCVAGEKLPVTVCYTFSTATIMWQDGTVESDIPSPELYPIHHLDELEFFPGDYVVDAKEMASKNCDYGVVVSCNHKERTCFVKWMKTVDVSKGERPEENIEAVEVSAYDLKDHPDFKFRPAQTVIRVIETQDEGKEAVGQIQSLDPRGAIIVKWPSGEVTLCYPQELYIVGDEMSEFDSSSWSTEEEETDENDDNSDMSWETDEEEIIENGENGDEGVSLIFITKEKKEELEALLSSAEAALENLQRLFLTFNGKITINYRYLKDIISVYKRCQDLEKIIKTHFFEEEELIKLLEELRELLYDEKRNDLNDKLLKIYEKRKGRESSESPNKTDSLLSSPTQTPEDTTGHVFPDIEKPCSPNKDLAQLASAIVTSVMKTFSAAQCQNIESNKEDNAMLLNGDSDFCQGATASAEMSISKDTAAMKFASSEKSSGKIENCPVSEEFGSVSSETKELNASQESGLEFSDCDSGLGESKGSGGSLERNALALMKRRKEEVCNKFCQLMLVQLVKVRCQICKLREYTKPFMNVECDSCEVHKQTDGQNQEEKENSQGARLVEELEMVCNTESNGETETREADGGETNDDSSELSELRQELDLCKQSGECATQGFVMCEVAPPTHKFASKLYSPQDPKSFLKAVRKEYQLLHSNLPTGIFVIGFEDRMDLFSVMILGPQDTPYEDGLFFFDVFLPPDYPTSPPVFHYISYCTDRLNPNLYEDGKVCVSLLGTWDGKGNEMWTSKSNMLQVLVSIQGLILVSEPYYNEAGFEKQRGSVIGLENSKMYNEMAIIKLVQSMTRMLENPPHSFKEEMTSHFQHNATRMIQRCQFWLEGGQGHTKEDSGVDLNCDSPGTAGLSSDHAMDMSSSGQTISQLQQDSLLEYSQSNTMHFKQPEFPLFPPSKGFCIPLKKYLETFKQTVERKILSQNEQKDPLV